MTERPLATTRAYAFDAHGERLPAQPLAEIAMLEALPELLGL